MRSWSPSYFSRWCTLWVVYVGLRALLLSLSLKAFCDLLTWGVRSQTRALIAWAGISTTPSGWTAIFLKPCVFFFSSFVSFFMHFFVLDWTIDRITELLPDLVFFCSAFCVLHHLSFQPVPLSVRVLFILKYFPYLHPLIPSFALFPVQYGGAVCYCDRFHPPFLCCLYNNWQVCTAVASAGFLSICQTLCRF